MQTPWYKTNEGPAAGYKSKEWRKSLLVNTCPGENPEQTWMRTLPLPYSYLHPGQGLGGAL
eukprot:1138089-Pelagomonas_calceolata.AAC.3